MKEGLRPLLAVGFALCVVTVLHAKFNLDMFAAPDRVEVGEAADGEAGTRPRPQLLVGHLPVT